MAKFKPGDKVRRTSGGWGPIKEGDIVTVASCDNNDNLVVVEYPNQPDASAQFFELVEYAPVPTKADNPRVWVDYAEDAASVARALNDLLTKANGDGCVNNGSDLTWSFDGALVASVDGAPSGLRVVWDPEIEAAYVEVGRDFR